MQNQTTVSSHSLEPKSHGQTSKEGAPMLCDVVDSIIFSSAHLQAMLVSLIAVNGGPLTLSTQAYPPFCQQTYYSGIPITIQCIIITSKRLSGGVTVSTIKGGMVFQ